MNEKQIVQGQARCAEETDEDNEPGARFALGQQTGRWTTELPNCQTAEPPKSFRMQKKSKCLYS